MQCFLVKIIQFPINLIERVCMHTREYQDGGVEEASLLWHHERSVTFPTAANSFDFALCEWLL